MRGVSLLNTAVAVLALCAVVTTGLVVRREFFAPYSAIPGPRNVPAWRSYVHDGHRMGSPDAPVTVVVFSDFQCPFCALLTRRLHALRAKYPKDIAVVYRHFPLAEHPYAVAAVRASECAAMQGRFEAFHDAVFVAQDSLGFAPWGYFARLAGVSDTTAFVACATSVGPIPALAHDTVAARALNVHVTPTFLINQTEFQGAVPLDTLEAYAARALHGVP